MAKIHPNNPKFINSPSRHSLPEREIFTVWMTSLVLNGNGCTVFNSGGKIIYRVDNYQTRRNREVFLMSSDGEVLFSIKRKNLQVFRNWEGHKLINSKLEGEGEWFKVKRKWNYIFGRGMSECRVTVGCNETTSSSYKMMVGFQGKSTLKIMDCGSQVLAEVNPKKMEVSGVSLGDDVLTLTVEPQIDRSFIMALVIVYGMMNNYL